MTEKFTFHPVKFLDTAGFVENEPSGQYLVVEAGEKSFGLPTGYSLNSNLTSLIRQHGSVKEIDTVWI